MTQIAYWVIELNTVCPNCGSRSNLWDDEPDIWEALEVGEHNTKRSANHETTCIHCGHDFIVECIY